MCVHRFVLRGRGRAEHLPSARAGSQSMLHGAAISPPDLQYLPLYSLTPRAPFAPQFCRGRAGFEAHAHGGAPLWAVAGLCGLAALHCSRRATIQAQVSVLGVYIPPGQLWFPRNPCKSACAWKAVLFEALIKGKNQQTPKAVLL